MTRRFVRLFQKRFAALVKAGTKRQTIRPTPRRMPKPGDILDARMWEGRPRWSKQIKVGEFVIKDVRQVSIYPEGYFVDAGAALPVSTDDFARADGFKDWDEMVDWFWTTHNLPFTGILICWV